MSQPADVSLLDAVLDSWDRNNRITVNLLRALPADGHDARVAPTSPTVIEMFAHMIYVRLVFIDEAAPDWARTDTDSWLNEADAERLESGLNSSGQVVREVLKDHISNGTPMLQHYDHPLLFLQHMIWHEGYHHGQIKLALKTAGFVLEDEEIGPVTWDLWIRKTTTNEAASSATQAHTEFRP